jgi:hypothetical protein
MAGAVLQEHHFVVCFRASHHAAPPPFIPSPQQHTQDGASPGVHYLMEILIRGPTDAYLVL